MRKRRCRRGGKRARHSHMACSLQCGGYLIGRQRVRKVLISRMRSVFWTKESVVSDIRPQTGSPASNFASRHQGQNERVLIRRSTEWTDRTVSRAKCPAARFLSKIKQAGSCFKAFPPEFFISKSGRQRRRNAPFILTVDWSGRTCRLSDIITQAQVSGPAVA